MKEVLIIFIILLVLLLILSAFGGSLRVKETYEDDDIPLYSESLIPEKSKPWAQNDQYIETEEDNLPQQKVSEEEVDELFNAGTINMEDSSIHPFDGYDEDDFAQV